MTTYLNNSDYPELTKAATAYLSGRPLFYVFIRPQEAALFRHFDRYLKPPLLDFGCGDGFFAQLLFSPNGVDTGLDLPASVPQESPSLQVYNRVQTYAGLTIPAKANSYPSVMSNCVFEHLPHLDANLAEIYRVLQPGGHLLTGVMTKFWDQSLLGGRILGEPYRRFLRRRQVHPNLLSLTDWTRRFQTSGFRVVHTVGYLHPPAAHLAELGHYLGIPSLVTYRLFHRWVVFPHWHQSLGLVTRLEPLLRRDVNLSLEDAAALFYVLQKPLIPKAP